MKKNDLITIIIPVYQSEKWLEQCLISIIGQTYQLFEVILVDDGSTDTSGFICDSYGNRDSRFKVIHQENKGASSARNVGINEATGKYIYFVDADDWLHEDCLQELIKRASGANDIVITNYNLVNEKKCYSNFDDTGEIELITRKDIILRLLKLAKNEDSCEGYLWNKLFLTKIIVENKIKFDSHFVMWEDMLFCYKYMLYVKKGTYVHKNLYYHRENEESLSYFLNISKANSWYKAAKVLYEYIRKYDDDIIIYYKGILANICMQNLIINCLENALNKCDDYHEKINFISQGKNGLRLKYKVYYFCLCISDFLFCIFVRNFKL